MDFGFPKSTVLAIPTKDQTLYRLVDDPVDPTPRSFMSNHEKGRDPSPREDPIFHRGLSMFCNEGQKSCIIFTMTYYNIVYPRSADVLASFDSLEEAKHELSMYLDEDQKYYDELAIAPIDSSGCAAGDLITPSEIMHYA